MSFNKEKAVKLANKYLDEILKNNPQELDLLYEIKSYKKSEWRVSDEIINDYYLVPIYILSIDLLLDNVVTSTYSLYVSKDINIIDEFFVTHFINGSVKSNHNWDLLVPDFNENEIKKIALKVLENGRHTPYKGIDSKVLDITHNEVTRTIQVTYKTNPKTGEIYIGNGWVL